MTDDSFNHLTTYEDCLFLKAVELGCQPLLILGKFSTRWLCGCPGLPHAAQGTDHGRSDVVWEALQKWRGIV